MPAKMCEICNKRRASDETDMGHTMCLPCWEYAGWENTHTDDNHDENPDNDDKDECLVCLGLDPADVEPVKGHSNGIAKSHTSHAQCSHPKTKSARAKCRKERAVKGD